MAEPDPPEALSASPAPDASDPELLDAAAASCRELSDRIGRVIVGQDRVVRCLIASTLAEGHALLIGVPGLAKTLLVKTLGRALGWDFRRIQFTPDMMPADIIGMELLQEDPETGRRVNQFVPGPVFANLILADEINRTPPKTQAALLEAMQERQVTSMGRPHALARPFMVVATQNPIEQEGTYPLPEAQLDRFMLSLWMDYPPVEEEERIVAASTGPEENDTEPAMDQQRMMGFQRLTRRIPASPHVVSYAVALARATRPEGEAVGEMVANYVQWGAGPRAAQHMVAIGKALAVIDGQPTVAAEHIREAAPYVLRHRLLMNYQAAGDGVTAAAVVHDVLQNVGEPSYA